MLKRKEKQAGEPKAPAKPKKQKAEKAPQYYRSATNIQTLNYRVYYMTKSQRILCFLTAFAVGAFAGYLFYGGLARDQYGNATIMTYILNVLISCISGTIAAVLYYPVREEQLLEKRRNILKRQFRDMLEALSTSFGTGKNVRDAFAAAHQDMKSQYEEDAFIVKELEVINSGINNSINVEKVLQDFAYRSGVKEIQNFADVFEITYRKGGNINQVVRNTYIILSDEMEVAEEIRTIVYSSRNEQNMMLIMPVVLVSLIKLSSADFARNFATPVGVMTTTVAIIIFAISYFIGRKILNIKV